MIHERYGPAPKQLTLILLLILRLYKMLFFEDGRIVQFCYVCILTLESRCPSDSCSPIPDLYLQFRRGLIILLAIYDQFLPCLSQLSHEF